MKNSYHIAVYIAYRISHRNIAPALMFSFGNTMDSPNNPDRTVTEVVKNRLPF